MPEQTSRTVAILTAAIFAIFALLICGWLDDRDLQAKIDELKASQRQPEINSKRLKCRLDESGENSKWDCTQIDIKS